MSTLPLSRCNTCNSTSENARNLVVFIDGTSNKCGVKNTNVVKMYDVVPEREDSKIQQKTLYLLGIGAYEADDLSRIGRLEKKISSGVDQAFARNVEENVKSAYRWLVREYRQGDQIYLFGFSRGAYQVRALAGMIHEVGLMSLQSSMLCEYIGKKTNHPVDPTSKDIQDLIDKTNRNDSPADPISQEIQDLIDKAYCHYRCIDPNNADPEPRGSAKTFKSEFCWYKLRVHFVGVWDTVSSLGFIKQDVHITSSSSVTNACHFRHALALDERRVKFIPEYFSEVNAHRIGVKSPRDSDMDVKEVWFAGHHSDVGGTSRGRSNENGPHAGWVSLKWMKEEAAASGLVFEPAELSWDPRDVNFGTVEKMGLFYQFMEILPIRHQVGFSRMGKHIRGLHLFRPRSVIPHQNLHPSILSGDLYTPRAALCAGVGIPTVPPVTSSGSWATEFLNEEAMTLLLDPQMVLRSLKKASFLLDFMSDKERNQMRAELKSLEETIRKEHDFGRFALAVVYDLASSFSVSAELVELARKSLCAILSSSNQTCFSGIHDIIRISTRNKTLGQRFISHKEVIGGLMVALDRTTDGTGDELFVSIMECLCYLINESGERNSVIDLLTTQSGGHARLSSVLDVKAPDHLTASLRMIASLGRHEPALCEALKPKIIEIAKKKRGSVGSAAVEALIELKGPIYHSIHFSNLLGCFNGTLPRLDAEIGSPFPPRDTTECPVLPVGVLRWVDEELVHKLVQSCSVQRRTIATLTLLKLCRYPDVLDRCLRKKVLNVFLKQMERKETSLLAAYALKTLASKQTFDDLDIPWIAQLIANMFDKGWFDDAVGRVEGSEIFGGLMSFDNLRQEVISLGILSTIMKKFECGERHGLRMSLICLDVLGSEVNQELQPFVIESMACLGHKGRKAQTKGVKVLSALALTKVGEEALLPRVSDIVIMLLPRGGQSPVPRSQLFGPTATLQNLCRNETVREKIKKSLESIGFKDLRQNMTLYPVQKGPDPVKKSSDSPPPTKLIGQSNGQAYHGAQPRKRVRRDEE